MNSKLRKTMDELLRRNEKPTKGFLDIPSLNIVKVPYELENEPYKVYDTGLRPELKFLGGIPFRFMVKGKKIVCNIGSIIHQRKFSGKILLSKTISDFSVADIYENYGLDITYSFLNDVYWSSIVQKIPILFATYLEGSMIALKLLPNRKLPITIDGLQNYIISISSTIMNMLIKIDNQKTKLKMPLNIITQELPFELLAKIISSTRICKTISNIVRQYKSKEEPDKSELACVRTNSRVTYFIKNQDKLIWNSTIIYKDPDIYEKYTLEYKNCFYMIHAIGDEIVNDTLDEMLIQTTRENIFQYSLSDYTKVYKRRGCCPRTSILALLNKISQMKVDSQNNTPSDNIEKICGWLVQLSIDTDSSFKGILENNMQLENILHKLAIHAIELINSGKLKL
jgi:hypothetical protein